MTPLHPQPQHLMKTIGRWDRDQTRGNETRRNCRRDSEQVEQLISPENTQDVPSADDLFFRDDFVVWQPSLPLH